MFLHDWKDSGIKRLKEDFGITDTELEGVNILLASYENEMYSGHAFVLFEKNGKLFEVNGSHCSCYGLGENFYGEQTQWEPEETTIEALRHRIAADGYELTDCKTELIAVLDNLESLNHG